MFNQDPQKYEHFLESCQIGDSMVSRENVTINYSNLITKLNDMSRHAPEFTHPTIQTRPSDDNDWMCSWPVLRALRVGFKGFEGFKGLRAWWRPWQCSWQGFEGNVEFLSSRSSPLDEVSKDFLWKSETIQMNSRTKYKEKKIPKCNLWQHAAIHKGWNQGDEQGGGVFVVETGLGRLGGKPPVMLIGKIVILAINIAITIAAGVSPNLGRLFFSS